MSTTIPALIPFPYHSSETRCVSVLGPSARSQCRHRPVWKITGVGYLCNGCYESYFAVNWQDIDVWDIHRLSDDERDFFGSNGGNNGNGSGSNARIGIKYSARVGIKYGRNDDDGNGNRQGAK